MKIWLLLNSCTIVLLAVALFVTVRQVGMLINRMPRTGARYVDDGPRIGEIISIDLIEEHCVGFKSNKSEAHKYTLLVFLSTHCSICKAIIEASNRLLAYWKDKCNILAIYDEAVPSTQVSSDCEVEKIEGGAFRERLAIPFVPFAVLLDKSQSVVYKALVNDLLHVESILEKIDDVETTNRAARE